VIIEDGIRRMYKNGRERLLLPDAHDENYEMPAMPEGVRDGILKGLYRLRAVGQEEGQGARAAARQRAILNEGRRAQADSRREVRRGPPTSGA
jgi:pyruvate dehydrogenase E1 component